LLIEKRELLLFRDLAMSAAKKESPDNHLKQPQPKIVFFRLGNMTLAEIHVFFE
jgi:hypothetical protein